MTPRLPIAPLERLFALTVGLLGLAIGAQPVSDNSTLVHMRTGIDIVAGTGIATSDPYSFTAAGEPWVVQSWLASVAYGLALRLGDGAFVLLQGVLTAAIALSIVGLARPAATPLRRAGVALVAIGVGGLTWSPRPLLIGLLCLGLLQLAVLRRWPWWSYLAIGWVWVNSHGSFPLGVAWIAAAALGAAIDERRLVTERLRDAGLVVAGLLVGAASPIGPRLLVFPLTVGDRRSVFSQIVEWQSPDFQSVGGVVSAIAVCASIALLAQRRAPWTLLLPVVGFAFLALYASRNLAPLGMVLVPALAFSAQPAGPIAPRLPAWTRRDRLAGALLGAGLVVVTANALAQPGLALTSYPVDVVRRAEASGVLAPGSRVAHNDVVGCYLILRRGRGAGVFIDDRYDMYPPAAAQAYLSLLGVKTDALDVLDRHRITAVLWSREGGLVTLLRSRGWSEVDGDKRWVLLTRPGGAPLPA